MIRVVHPGSRIRMLTFSHPGSRGQKGTKSRIRNTDKFSPLSFVAGAGSGIRDAGYEINIKDLQHWSLPLNSWPCTRQFHQLSTVH
jgi:hypothetical protein